MSDLKISELTAATTLGATDEMPLASSGATKKITGANLKTDILLGVVTPWLVQINPLLPPASNTGYATFYTYDSGAGAGRRLEVIRYGTAQNDEIAWNVLLGAGTWTLELIGDNGSDRGISTITLGAVGTLGTKDAYTASGGPDISYSITGITVATTGIYLLKFASLTKHASSSGYAFALAHIQMRRTA